MGYSDPEAQRRYQREWLAKRRADYLADKKCARCGGTENLELDHIDPRQKIDHGVWSWSAIRRNRELAKCQVLCESCHKIKTREQIPITHGRQLLTHGNRHMYSQGCRCQACVSALRAYWRDYRLRKKLGDVGPTGVSRTKPNFVHPEGFEPSV